MRIEFDEKCKACHGTGLYKGFAERDGYAVVCHNCKGTGKFHFVHVYEEFERKEIRDGIHTIIQTNPGFQLGGAKGEYDFGGISYQAWLNGEPFKHGTEMRRCVCPAWWYQSADYSKKPEWKECWGVGAFSQCKYFTQKEKCWERWDKEVT
jgi:hypothetical protein